MLIYYMANNINNLGELAQPKAEGGEQDSIQLNLAKSLIIAKCHSPPAMHMKVGFGGNKLYCSTVSEKRLSFSESCKPLNGMLPL